MWATLRLLTIFLCAQVCAGQASYRVARAVDQDDLRRTSPESATYSAALPHASTAVHTAEYDSGQALLPNQRELGFFFCVLVVSIIIASTQNANRRLQPGDAFATDTQISVVFTITDPTDGATDYAMIVDATPNGEAVARLGLTSTTQTNKEDTGLCDDCTLTFVAGECLSGDCDSYDMEATNANINILSSVCGDPHMVGLLGQKIDWAGEDGGWYCLISDGDGFHLNVRVTAPMPEEFPDRQLVTGVSLLLPDGHSLVVEVKDPYTLETHGCAAGTGSPCLADGALRILVDNKEAHHMQTPAEDNVLAEGVQVSATNLPAECRPFGGDRIWAKQFDEITAAERSLRETSTTLAEWVLEPDTLAAPTWCAKYLEDGVAGLLATQGNHATLRIETPLHDLRLNIGINHQELVSNEEGNTVVPELEFWQTDIQLEHHHFSDTVGGMLGDTSRFVFDDAGNPIRKGIEALHGPVEGYRVADALAVDFEQLHY